MIKPLFQNILVLITGSESSINATKYAVLMSKLYGCKVHALFVVDTATIKQLLLNKIFIKEESMEYENSLKETGNRYLNYVKEIGKNKGVDITTEMRSGSVSTEVLHYAEENKIDAILIGADDSKTDDSKNIQAKTFHAILDDAKCSIFLINEQMIEHLYKIA